MRDFKDAKNIYDHIVVPEELDSRLRDTLENAPKTKRTTIHIVRFTRWASAAALTILSSITKYLLKIKQFLGLCTTI